MVGDGQREWLLIDRELGIPGEEDGSARWAADAVFVDRDGIPAIVEVKRSSDTRLRREVVGQLLDYAAHAVVHWQPGYLYDAFATRCREGGEDPDQLLEALLGTDEGLDGFWDQVGTNLQAGQVCLVLVADEIPAEVRRVVEFLNRQMAPAEVFAVEIGHYVGQDLSTLVPRVLGLTVESERRRRGAAPRRSWTRAEVLEDFTGRCSNEAEAVVAAIVAWSDEHEITVATGSGASGAFVFRYEYGGRQHAMFNISAGSCKVQVSFGNMGAPFDTTNRRQELADRLNNINGLELDDSNLEVGWPTFPLEALVNQDALEQFLQVWNWYCEEIRRCQNDRDRFDRDS